ASVNYNRNKMLKRIPLHTQIISGLVLGLLFGLLVVNTNMSPDFTLNYIKPIGTIFINALKMIAVPLVLASLVVGVSNLGDISKLSRIGENYHSLYDDHRHSGDCGAAVG